MKRQYLNLLGWQSHVQCDIHKRPLITSYDKEKKCACGKRSSLCCGEVNCDVQLCKKCFSAYDCLHIHCIDANDTPITSEDEDNYVSEEESPDKEQEIWMKMI